MTVTVQAADRPDLPLDLNHQNFNWLMTSLELPYTHESQSMLPSEVKAACSRFYKAYCYHATLESVRSELRSRWIGLIQARRTPAPIMSDTAEVLGGTVVDVGPNYADLGDPLDMYSDAGHLKSQLNGYVRQLSKMAAYCERKGQAIIVY